MQEGSVVRSLESRLNALHKIPVLFHGVALEEFSSYLSSTNLTSVYNASTNDTDLPMSDNLPRPIPQTERANPHSMWVKQSPGQEAPWVLQRFIPLPFLRQPFVLLPRVLLQEP